MKNKFLIFYHNKVGYLFVETAFRLWILLEWYWDRYRIGEEFNDEHWLQKLCERLYDIGADNYNKATNLEKQNQ